MIVGTVVSEEAITEAVQEFKTKRQFESDSHGNIPMPVGMVGGLIVMCALYMDQCCGSFKHT